MRRISFSLLAMGIYSIVFAQVGIGTTTPNPNAVLDLSSSDKALLLPRLTQAQRNSIAGLTPGMTIFNTTSRCIEIYRGNDWWNICENNVSAHIPGIKSLLGGNNPEQANSVWQTTDGGFVVAGYANSSNNGTLAGYTNNGQDDYWILRLNDSLNIQWQVLLGGSDFDQATSIQQTSDGGFIVAGYSFSANTGTLTGLDNNGSADYWILKLTSAGVIDWHVLLGGGDFDQAKSIQQTSDGGYIIAGVSYSSDFGTLTGYFNNGEADYWIVKLNSSGTIQWQQLIGGSGVDIATSVQQTTDNGYIIAGYSTSSETGTLSTLTNNGIWDYWIVKLDNAGVVQWQRLLGGSSTDQANGIEQTADGGYIIAGFSSSSNNGSLSGQTNNGAEDFWIVKLNSSGNISWQKLFGGSADEEATSIQETTDGGYIVAGFSQSSNSGTLAGLSNYGGSDYLIMKLDNSGNIQWQKMMGGNSTDHAYSVRQTLSGGYVVAGYSMSGNSGSLNGVSNHGNRDYWIFLLNGSGF